MIPRFFRFTHRLALFILYLIISIGCFCRVPMAAEVQEEAIVEQTDPHFLQSLKTASEYKVAILPMENFTVEGDIAYHFRTRLAERLRAKGYTLIDAKLLDEALYTLGVAHAGQLKLLPFEELQKLT